MTDLYQISLPGIHRGLAELLGFVPDAHGSASISFATEDGRLTITLDSDGLATDEPREEEADDA